MAENEPGALLNRGKDNNNNNNNNNNDDNNEKNEKLKLKTLGEKHFLLLCKWSCFYSQKNSLVEFSGQQNKVLKK